MSGPTTETGKRLWDKEVRYGYVRESEVLAIEAEAKAQERKRLRLVAQAIHEADGHLGTSFLACDSPACEFLARLLSDPDAALQEDGS